MESFDIYPYSRCLSAFFIDLAISYATNLCTFFVRPMAPISDVSCLLKGSTSVGYSHQTFQAMPSCSAAIAPPSSYALSGIHNDSNEECYRIGKSGGQKDTVSQPSYYPMPFPVHPTSQTRDVRAQQPTQVGLSPLDFIRATAPPQSTCDREANHRFMIQNQKSLGYCGDQFYSRPTELSSLSSFSDDNCESGATTPASERSMGSSGGLSSRSSLLSVTSEASICSNSGTGQIFLSQSTGSYYKLQPPHFITAS